MEELACGAYQSECKKIECPENSIVNPTYVNCPNERRLGKCCCDDGFIAALNRDTGKNYCKEVNEEPLIELEYTHREPFNSETIKSWGHLKVSPVGKYFKADEGKAIILYIENGNPLVGVIEETVYYEGLGLKLYDMNHVVLLDVNGYLGGTYLASDWNVNLLDHNYMQNLNREELTERLRDKTEINGSIQAILLDTEKMKVIGKKEIPLKFDRLAQIKEIISIDQNDLPKVRVQDNDGRTRGVSRPDLPYALLAGDVVLLDHNDLVVIQWVDGTQMTVKPKANVLNKEQLAKVHIGLDGMGGGWTRYGYDATQNFWFNALIYSAGGAIIGITNPVTGTALSIGAPVGIYLSGTYNQVLDFEMHSTILIDYSEDRTTFYTVEGIGILESQNITSGNKIIMYDDGRKSDVIQYDKSEIDDEMKAVLDSLEEEKGVNSFWYWAFFLCVVVFLVLIIIKKKK
ncbi:MAG: hypothetical protein E4G94_05615 [ANME-2 cluster archaeon]|nr:MAG: hypothetical protein E4G94_05615 [ANME-2 cluster archaeon]